MRAGAKAKPLLAGGAGTATAVAFGHHRRRAESRRRRAHAATSCPQRGEPALHTQDTHTRTHALEFIPDQEEAARDPGDATTWAQAISREKEKRKEKRSRAEFGPEGRGGREAQEDFRPDDALLFFFFFYTTLTRGSHLSVRPAD